MSSVDQRLEASIANFFSEAGACTTRSQCDAFASKSFGCPVRPVPLQGVCSYTVAAANDTVIVQFRESDSPLDVQMITAIQKAHPDFVAGCTSHGTIGSSPALRIYSMNKLPGDNYSDISLSISDEDLNFQLATVKGLARFFAQSWQGSSVSDAGADSVIFEDCCSDFDYLSNNLPTRFQKSIGRVREHLSTLFCSEYPLVITHGDLSQMNILANPKTGDITGIIDWAEARIQPFGFALYSLDNMLGYLSLDGWVAYSTAKYLRDEFWKMFCEIVGGLSQREMELIQLARLAGLFLRYGIPYRPGRKGVVGVGGAQNASIKVLEALVPGEHKP